MTIFNRAQHIDHRLVSVLADLATTTTSTPRPRGARLSVDSPLTGDDLLQIFRAQMTSRHLDLIARRLRAAEAGYYTIGSAGHETNAILGQLTRPSDPAFLHYRSGAFVAARAQLTGRDIVDDTLLGCVASRRDPISGGRHKVWGSKSLAIPPQTSTIASHLPKAFGTAVGIARAHRLQIPCPYPSDALVICSFGDASTHHSVAQGAFNAAAYATRSGIPAAILFVCEDNGIGISVPTPEDWIEASYSPRCGLRYLRADGADPLECARVVQQAIDDCRTRRRPVFLHLRVVRLLGHAGSDHEWVYRSIEEIEATERRDPLLVTARLLVEHGIAQPAELLAEYETLRWRVEEAAGRAAAAPKLASVGEICSALAPNNPQAIAEEAARTVDDAERRRAFDDHLPEDQPPRHLAVQINAALTDLMVKYPAMTVFGEDVARKGGVYRLTTKLLERFGPARVFNTVLDETTILGLAQGFASAGLLPCPEIQYLAYLHNAIDQLRSEACSTQFFSLDQFRSPMLLRVASFGYQKGFGGHFHNDNSIAALRDIPSLIIAAPSRGDDAAKMLRSCAAAALVDGRVIAFLEPIALYMTKDLYAPGDNEWLTNYPSPSEQIPIGEGRVYHDDAEDVVLISYANGVHLSLRAARHLARAFGIRARVVDLRWLKPLNVAFIVEQVRRCKAAVIVDEGRRTGGVVEQIGLALLEQRADLPPIDWVTGEDTYIPLGPAARVVLPDEHQIAATARRLLLHR